MISVLHLTLILLIWFVLFSKQEDIIESSIPKNSPNLEPYRRYKREEKQKASTSYFAILVRFVEWNSD
jgi:hypothetical protein